MTIKQTPPGEIEITKYGKVLYNSGSVHESPEEKKRKNAEYYAHEESFVEEILADGYIEFPIMFETFGEIIWSKCYLPPNFIPSNSEGFREKFGMDFNIYIPSYKRANNSLTFNYLKKFGIENVYMCVDPSQYPEYKKVHGTKNLIVRDPSFRDERKMDLMSSIECSDVYHGAASIFNPLLYISKSLGEDMYFTMDDDFWDFGIKARKSEETPKKIKYDKDLWYRANDLKPEEINLKEFLGEFGDLFMSIRNRGMMGLEKFGLSWDNVFGSYVIGTKIYSCYLSSNDRQLDHYSRQNDDIITSLEMSKAGFANVTFEGLCYNSMDTQAEANSKDKKGEGGMTEVYRRFGTLDKGLCLVRAHPNHAKIAYRYNRIHHIANYSAFNKRRLLPAVKK